MFLFRLFLAACIVAITVYTWVTASNHSLDLLPVFFGKIMNMGWSGRFNLDFLTFLLLSGLWVSWRHHFSVGGIALGLIAVFGRMLFLAIYLLIVSFRTKGDIKAVMLGETRARG